MTDGGSTANRKVRVLQLITRLIVGGAQETAIAVAAGLDPDRYDVELWIGPQTGPEGSLLDDARRRGLRVTVFPDLVREISPIRDMLITMELARRMRQRQFDIVQTHSSKAGIVGRIAARLAGVPHVTHVVHGWGFHERMHPLVRWVYVVLERAMSRISRPLVSVSNRTTRIGLESGIGSVSSYRLIRSGIPLSVFHADGGARAKARAALNVGPGDVLIGSVGRLSPQKNPRDFVKVASAVLARHENVRFAYVGDGPLRPDIEAQIASEGIGERLALLGLRDDVPDLLRAFDLFILTSLWEGLPRVVPQALATGVPVVAYDVAGIEESLIDGRNGYLVPVGDAGGMVDRLDRLISDEAHRAEMGARAVEEFDESFSEAAMVRGFELLYADLMSGKVE